MEYKFNEEIHAHTLDGKPLLGTSTVGSVIAKPLTWWASGLACEKLGWINKGNAKKGWTPKELRLQKAQEKLAEIRNLSDEQYLDLLDEAYKAHSVKLDTSAQSGTDLHAELEEYVKNQIQGKVGAYSERILPFITWAEENVEKFLWSEINCFSEELWVGGISDAGAKLKDSSVAIIDFKSSKEAYESQFWQCAGYDIEISENGGYDKDGNKIFELEEPITQYIIFPFGADKLEPQIRFNVDECRDAFRAEVLLYKLMNK